MKSLLSTPDYGIRIHSRHYVTVTVSSSANNGFVSLALSWTTGYRASAWRGMPVYSHGFHSYSLTDPREMVRWVGIVKSSVRSSQSMNSNLYHMTTSASVVKLLQSRWSDATFPSPFISLHFIDPLPFFSLSSLPSPLEVGPFQLGVLGKRCNLPSGVWGRSRPK